MKRAIIGTLTAVGLTLTMSAGASAHYLHIETPDGETHHHWVGGPALPGQGAGLIPGGPTGQDTIAPAHEAGLVKACEAIRANGNGVVDIFGPYIPGQETCRHGGR